MIYNKMEMVDLLLEYTNLDNETLNLILKVAGDNKQTYLKILKETTGYNTFIELEEKGTKRVNMYDLDEDYDTEEEGY